MITPKEVEVITEDAKETILSSLIELADTFIKSQALQLQDGETRAFNIGIQIVNNFQMNDDNQVRYNYNKLLRIRMVIADDLANRYREKGWEAEVFDRLEADEHFFEPVILFSIKK